MLDEVATSFTATSECTCATSTMVSHPTQLATDLVPPPLEHSRSQVTPPWAAQTTTSSADAPTQDEVGDTPSFGPAELTADANIFSTLRREDYAVDVNDSSTARRLKSFTRRVRKKVDSPLIREPPKQPPATSVLPWQSRRLAAQSLSRVPASKRGEVLIM
jgi:hypothetical protein